MDTQTITKPNGASACSIAARLAMIGTQHGSYPADAGDFGRCEDFLDQFPSLRPSLHLMGDVNDYWKALVAQWEDIRAAPAAKRTALITAIIRPIQRGDRGHIDLRDGNSSMRFGANTYRADDPGPAAEAPDPFKRGDKPRMKEDPDFRKHNNHAFAVTADELRQFIERFEHLDAEKRDIAEQQKDLMAEAKGRGYDTRVMRMVVALRKRKPDDLAEEQAVLDLYKSALGMT